MKFQITIDDKLAKRVDKYAEENYMSRSGFIALACALYLREHESNKSVQQVVAFMRHLADTGMINHDIIDSFIKKHNIHHD